MRFVALAGAGSCAPATRTETDALAPLFQCARALDELLAMQYVVGTVEGWHALLVEPGVDVFGVEAEEMTPFDEGDPSLEDEPADMRDANTQVLGDLGDIGQATRRLVTGGAIARAWAGDPPIRRSL